jgi:hypothetical protein
MYFNVNNDTAIALKCSVTVSKSEQLPEDGQVRPKHVATDGDFNVILNKERL